MRLHCRAAFAQEESFMNANVDYCGILNLLRQLVDKGACTYTEATDIAAEIARQTGADIIIRL